MNCQAMRGSRAAILAAVLAVPIAALSGPPDAREIMEKSYYAGRVQDSTGSASLVLYNASGQKRVRETTSVGKLAANGKDQMRVIRFASPADVKGTGFLLIEHSGGDDDMWIYLPALRKVRRLVAKEKSNSFMGSEFSYADIADPDVDEYQHTLLGEEKIEDVDCWKIGSTPANEKVKEEQRYGKKVSWIRKDNFMAVKIEFYDLDGSLLKTMLARDIKEVDQKAHKWFAHFREMRSQSGRRSELVFKNLKVNVGVSADLFTPQTLERER